MDKKIEMSITINDRTLTQQMIVSDTDTVRNIKDILKYLGESMLWKILGDKELENQIKKMIGDKHV